MGDLIDWNHIVSLGTAAPPHFGDPQREFDAARSGAAVVPITQFELLRFHGGDAQAFLQGQLTCDLDRVTPRQAQFGGYCTPQGRLLANFLLLSVPQGYLMYLPADVAAYRGRPITQVRAAFRRENRARHRPAGAGRGRPGRIRSDAASSGPAARAGLHWRLMHAAPWLRLPGRGFSGGRCFERNGRLWEDPGKTAPSLPARIAGTGCRSAPACHGSRRPPGTSSCRR